MSALQPNGAGLRKYLLGPTVVSKTTGTLTAATTDLFLVTGGIVMITSLIGLVNTSVTVANSFKLTNVPTVGDPTDVVAATDIGTTDTLAGTVLGFDGTAASSITKGSPGLAKPLFVPTGKIRQVSAGTDGQITWYCTWVPYNNDNALLVAA